MQFITFLFADSLKFKDIDIRVCKNMNCSASVGFLVLFCSTAAFAIHSEVLEQLYLPSEYLTQRKFDWIFLLLLMTISVYYVSYGLLYLCQHKITLFDASCIIVYNNFALVFLTAVFPVKLFGEEMPYFRSVALLPDWVLLSFFSWIPGWTQYTQRGW